MRKRQVYEQWPTTGTDTLKAIEAIQAALAAPTDNQRSPAWAVNFIWNEMENMFKSQFDWIDWFISASYESISKHLCFDENTRCYTNDSGMTISGKYIVLDCLKWIENKRDLARSPGNSICFYNDSRLSDFEPAASERILKSLIPGPDEIYRRTWVVESLGETTSRCVDVWRTDPKAEEYTPDNNRRFSWQFYKPRLVFERIISGEVVGHNILEGLTLSRFFPEFGVTSSIVKMEVFDDGCDF